MPDRPLRFLIGADVPPDPNSGAAGTVYWTNHALRELGHEVDEIWQDDLPHRIKHGNLHYLLELPRAYRDAVRQRCAKKDYDVIMLSQPHAWLAAKDHKATGRPGIFLNRSHGWEPMAFENTAVWRRKLCVPENVFPRSALALVLRRLLDRSVASVVRYSNGLVVPAHDIKTHILSSNKIQPDRICVSHHGVHESFHRRPVIPMTPERLQKILYVGQFAFIKGPHILAESVSRVLLANPNATMTWVCSRKDHGAAKALLHPATAARAMFLDWVDQQDLINIYDSHGIFIFPSFYEGAGKACLEAMSRGLCVVATNVGAMVDIIRHKSSGFLVDTGSIAGFTDAVRQLLNNINMSRVMGDKAREATQSISWLRVARDVCDFVDCIWQQEKSRQVS